MKDVFKNNKKNLLKLLLVLIILIVVSIVTMLLLLAFDLMYFVDGDLHFNEALFHSFKNSWYGWLIVVLLQMLLTSLLCFVPGASMAFILLVQSLYSNPWLAFAVSFTSVLLTSCVMYIVGRFGGYRLCVRLLGRHDCHKAITLLRNKGQVFFPIMMMFPIFPDDALVMMAGTIRMTLRWFIPSVVIGRGIGVAAIIFGLHIIPFEKFTTPWHWIIFVILCIILVGLIFFLAIKFNQFMEKKKREEAEKLAAEKAEKKAKAEAEAIANPQPEAVATTNTTTQAEDATKPNQNA